MSRRRLLWQLYPSYLLITIASLLTVLLFGSRELHDFYREWTADDLRSRAWLLEPAVAEALASSRPERVDQLCKGLGKKSSTRITVILPSGKVVGDSEESPAVMENHGGRPEVRDALAGQLYASTHYSRTLHKDMMYVAIPMKSDGRIIAVLRASVPLTAIRQALTAIQLRIALGGLVVAVLAAGVSLFVSRRITGPLERIKRGAEQFARGDLSRPLPGSHTEEIAALADTMNRMAADLDDRIRTVVRQRNEREAILSSMVEGVFAVDSQLRLITLNQAAASIFGVDVQAVHGRSLGQIVRNGKLQELVNGVLARREPLEDDIVLQEEKERYLHAQGTVLHDADARAEDAPAGALVVLHDVTRLRRLETVRRDFVANVSHELRTPITSIKGFVETLLDGAMNNPADAERFLKILATQADRLNGIIEDLLILSRVEQDAQKAGIALEPGSIRDVLTAAIDVCHLKAAERNVQVELVCESGLRARINAALLEQAVVNLVDNAVKHSGEGQTVHVEAAQVKADHVKADHVDSGPTDSGPTDLEVVIRVRDHGCGISPEHLPRLFERFYRADKARSRKLGGTGLGLAIVKHIAQAHGGRATADSTPGVGSVFCLYLPAAR